MSTNFIGRTNISQPMRNISAVTHARCTMSCPTPTPTIEQARIMPGTIGLEYSKMWRNHRLTMLFCSAEIVMPLLALSTIGAEKRAPPTLGSSPRKAGITASVTLVE